MTRDNEASAATDCSTDSLHIYPSFEMMYHFEQDAKRKSVEFERLWELHRNDTTVNTFIEAWRRGHFRSFEDMLCKLAVQLASEKAEYMKTATKAIQFAPVQSVIVKSDG